MIIYQKCLKRLAITQIVLTAIEILVVILIYAILGRAASAEAHKASLITSLPQYGIELFSGIVVLIMYQQKKRYNLLFRIEIALFIGLITGAPTTAQKPSPRRSQRSCASPPSQHPKPPRSPALRAASAARIWLGYNYFKSFSRR